MKRKTQYGAMPKKKARVQARVAGPGVQALRGRVAKGYTRTSGFYGRFPPSGSENKFFDTAVGFNYDTVGEVPATGQLCLIPQGVTESTRVGRKCVIKSIQIRGRNITAYAATANPVGSTHLFLILDKQCNGAAAAAADVFTGTGFDIVMRNLSNNERFQVLKKWEYTYGGKGGVAAAVLNECKLIKYFKKCDIPLEFSSTTGAITELKSNNLFFMAGATGAGGLDDLIAFEGTVRLRFSDN